MNKFKMILTTSRCSWCSELNRPVSQAPGDEIEVSNDEAWRLLQTNQATIKPGQKGQPTEPDPVIPLDPVSVASETAMTDDGVEPETAADGDQTDQDESDEEQDSEADFDDLGLATKPTGILREQFKTLDALESFVLEGGDLTSFDGVGQATADHVLGFFTDETAPEGNDVG